MIEETTAFLEHQLADLKQQGLFNDIRTIESAIDGHIVVNGRRCLNLTSNNYLGFANHPRLREAAKRAIDQYGIGPAAVRSIAGTMSLHAELEARLAAFKHAEAAITFQGGFMANIAAIPALVGDEDVIFSDELNHASIIEGCRLSRARIIRYAHNDPADLARKIAEAPSYRRGMVISDGVFSMDGDIAPVPELLGVARQHGLLLMIDDAHGEGVLGQAGRGIVDHFGLHGQVDVEIGTLSKAFGVVGGIVAGRKVIIDWLRQRARPFLFSSAMTVPDVAACLEAVALLEESDAPVRRLWENAAYLKQELRAAGFNTGRTETPIIPVIIGDNGLARQFAARLFEAGLFVVPIVYPTVPHGTARIRVMNSAAHDRADLEAAVATFRQIGGELGII